MNGVCVAEDRHTYLGVDERIILKWIVRLGWVGERCLCG